MGTDIYGNYQPAISDNGVNDGPTTSGAAGLSGVGSPESVQEAIPGTTYLDTSTDSFWVKKTGTGTTGWVELIASIVFFLMLCLGASAQPIMRNYYTTNTAPTLPGTATATNAIGNNSGYGTNTTLLGFTTITNAAGDFSGWTKLTNSSGYAIAGLNDATNAATRATNGLGSAAFTTAASVTNAAVGAAYNATNALGSAAWSTVGSITNAALGAAYDATNALGASAWKATTFFDLANAALNATNGLFSTGYVKPDYLGASGGAGKFLRYDQTWQTITQGSGGAASNAVSVILTNSTDVSSGAVVSNLNFISRGGITLAGTNVAGQANIAIGLPDTLTNALSGPGGTITGPLLSTSSTTNAPSDTELATAGWTRGLFNNGIFNYITTNIDATATNTTEANSVVYKFQTTIPNSAQRGYTNVAANQYIGSVITTNTFTVLQGPVAVDSYLAAVGSANESVSIKPEIYYSYDKTNWLGDFDAQAHPIPHGSTNLHSWVISFQTVTSTNATGFYVERRFKVTAASGTTPAIQFLIGTNAVGGNNSASHISMAGPNSALGNAYLANNQTFTGNNTFSPGVNSFAGTLNLEGAVRVWAGSMIGTNVITYDDGSGSASINSHGGTRTFLNDATHTVITNTATLTSSEWTAGSQKEWYNGAATMTIDKTNGFITANGFAVTTNASANGVLAVRKLTITNLTGNITLAGFSGIDTTLGQSATLLAIADSSTRSVALPANCFSADGARTYYVTNGTARLFQFTVFGNVWTNCACIPSF